MCMDIISIQYIFQRPLTKYLRCPLSIPTHIFNVHCPYKSLSISTISNTKVDQYQSRSSNAVKQIQLGSNKCFRSWTRRVLEQGSICSFLLAESEGVYLFIFLYPQISWGTPLNLGREPLGFLLPVVALVTICSQKRWWNTAC